MRQQTVAKKMDMFTIPAIVNMEDAVCVLIQRKSP